MRSRSSSWRTMVSRSWPMSTRSREDSKSSMPMVGELRRTACSAASLTRFARSAPLMPGVPRATMDMSTRRIERFTLEWT